MEYTLSYGAIPLAVTEARDPRQLTVQLLPPLAAPEAVRRWVPPWPWAGVTAVGTGGLSDGVEWRDALGAPVPAARIDVWLTGAGELLVFTRFDADGAGIPAPLRWAPRADFREADG